MFSKWFSKPETPPTHKPQPIYTPITKHYVFNETGNIMLCATADSIQSFDVDLKSAFVDISVFFAAMTKAVTSTTNPVTGKPFSIFNYQAVKNILADSGLFIETNVEEGTFSHDGVGDSLGKALFQHILNREFSEKQLPFAKSMFNGMQYQRAKTTEQSAMSEEQQKLCRSGSIFFIGELLMGVPQTSAILLSIEPQSVADSPNESQSDWQDLFSLAGLDETKHQAKHIVRHWRFKKRTYLFVPPKFIAHGVAGLGEQSNADFDEYSRKLAQSIAPNHSVS
ncbi:hypothetical protein [Pseudoalteromonas piscicida]|uniref:Uncharacterized protein n=1 Tax=Pseudoalteromonas piscicida TaxID=43662 RepID=A0A2A5JLN2_PSEO7|nr:hypothetical protein [Pseudoalteromonas piscicida]PCK30340.1 hypothetical protein CEX98_17950 [Pseudoalteromonas piscicida]